MKKFMKFCGVLVAIVLIIGLVLLLIGSFNGGLPKLIEQIKNGELSIGPEDFGWNSDWKVYSLGDGSMFTNEHEKIENKDFYETAYTGASVSGLAINVGGCEVKLAASPDESFYVSAEKIGTLQTYIVDGTLYVSGLDANMTTFVPDNHMKIEILVPLGTVLTTVELELGAGTFSVDYLETDVLSMELGAGQITIADMRVNNIECEVGAGQAVIENAEIYGNIGLSVGAGELRLTGKISGDLTAECGMGNIEIHVLGSREADHNFDMSCAAGNLQAGSYSIAGLVGDKEVQNGANSTFTLECALGNMTVTFEE